MFSKIIQRTLRMVKLDWTVFGEIRRDTQANAQAALIVLIVSIVSAIAAGIGAGNFFGAFLVRLLSGVLLNFMLWSYATTFIITNFYGSDADFWQVARVLGYANLPMILVVLGVFGCLGGLVASLAWVVVLVVAFFGMREAFELSTERTIVAVAVSWLVILIASIPLNLIFAVR